MEMNNNGDFKPVFELTRGGGQESLHFGAAAVVDAAGRLHAWVGDPDVSTFIRSAAKPLQVLPFIEAGGVEHFGLSERDLALMCASHSGTDEHVQALEDLQKKVSVCEQDLLCGVHPPLHKPTAQRMQSDGRLPTPNRHNCSGKHTGMLAFAAMKRASEDRSADQNSYIDPDNTIQKEILRVVAEMCEIPVQKIQVGIDGCSAPNFRLPLRNAALAFARLADPEHGGVAPARRRFACQKVCSAMMAYPDMVAGPDRFDTAIMQVGRGRILAKGGAEGYQAISLMPGVLGPDSPAVGITLKIADGDRRGTAKPAVVLEILRQIGALSDEELAEIQPYGPQIEVRNWREIIVGEGRPCFTLET